MYKDKIMKRLLTISLLFLATISQGQFRMGFTYQHKARKASSIPPAVSGKINLVRDQVFPQNHTIGDNYMKMFDGKKLNTDTARFLPNGANDPITYPYKIIIDLRGYYTLERIKLRDETGEQTMRWYKYTSRTNVWPENFTKIGTDIVLSGYQSDTSTFAVQRTDNSTGVRFIMLEMVSALGRFPSEIELWGTKTADDFVEPTIAPRPEINVADVLGANAFQYDTPSKVALFTSQRIFFNTEWITDDDRVAYWMSPAIGGALDIKPQITTANNNGVSMIFCVQHSAPELFNLTDSSHHDFAKPIPYGANENDPESYTRAVETQKQLALYLADGGPGTLADSKISTTPNPPWNGPNVKEIYLNKQFWIENNNEPDKWWSGGSGSGITNVMRHFTPRAYYNYMLKAYTTIKGIAPNAKIAMGGMANTEDYYLKAIWLFAYYNNGGVMPFDAVNYHFYPSDGAQFDGSRGISPEAYNFTGKIAQLSYWRNKYIPSVEFWNSEYGYDTNNSDKKAQYNGVSADGDPIIQGRWLYRVVMALMMGGVDKAHLYWLSDNSAVSNETFTRSGIVAAGNANKASYQFYESLSATFKGKNYVFKENLSVGTHYCARFKDAVANKTLFIFWRGTENVYPNKLATVSTTVTLSIPISPVSTTQGVAESGNVASVTPITVGGTITGFTTNTNESPNWIEIQE